jgi:ssDNA-binding Zn-finger/Zn-ribbon topoisomerase 1
MILKDKEPIQTHDPRIKSGDDAERQMAHYLKREFGKRNDCFVLNDLRLTTDEDDKDEVAQIDHLLVTRFGFFVIESKAGDIKVDARGQWIRDGKGMRSAVNQAERQGKLLRELIQADREMLRGKRLFGKFQCGFLGALVECFVAVSDTGIISTEVDIPNLDKADNIPNLVRARLQVLEEKSNLMSVRGFFSTDVTWEMTPAETQAVAEFLLRQHQPAYKATSTAREPGHILNVSVESTTVLTKSAATRSGLRAGSVCTKCGQGKLERGSVKRSDGTETDFYSCSSCKKKFPMGALESVDASVEAAPSPSTTPPIQTQNQVGQPCPRCNSGHLVRRPGKNGKPPFFACSNYSKTKCGYMKSIE